MSVNLRPALLFFALSQFLAATSAVSNSNGPATTAAVSGATSTLASGASSTIFPSTVAASSSSASATITATQSGANFPPVGSVPEDFSPQGLENLWDIVGPVEAPPFTTTRVPETPIILPSPPPALYPQWFTPAPKDLLPNYKFPKGFKFGVATAAYQVEGAVKNEGKGPTLWDWASRQPDVVVDNTTADVVDLQYFLYKEDVARVAALGVNAHSFS